MKRLLFALLFLIACPPYGTDYYVDPSGSGSTCSNGSPCTVATAIGLVSAGDTIYMKDGTYTGASGNIDPTTVNGTSGSRITIRAVNEGSVLIDGEGARAPVIFNNSDYWDVIGINAHNSDGPVYYIANGSSNIRIYRSIGWDAATGNNHVFSWDASPNGLCEDCAAFGIGRKMFEFFNGSNDGTCRRCYARKSAEDGSGGVGFEVAYNSSGTTLENVIASWAKETGGASPGGHGGPIYATGAATGGTDDSKVLGSIAYIRSSDTSDATGAVGVNSNAYVDVDFINVVAYIQPGSHSGIYNFILNNPKTSSSVTDITTIQSGGLGSSIGSDWSVTDHVTSSTPVNIYDSGSGAEICYRYQDRTLTSTALFPWPMDERIKAALLTAGYQSVTAGFSNDTGYVTDAIEEMFGTIPALCGGDVNPGGAAINIFQSGVIH